MTTRNLNPGFSVAVGPGVTPRPPHRSRRAGLPHRAPASGDDAQALISVSRPAVSASASTSKLSGSVSGSGEADADSNWPVPFPPPPPQTRAHPRLCSGASQVLWDCPTSHARASLTCPLGSQRGPLRPSPGPIVGSPGSRAECLSTRMGSSTAPGPATTRDSAAAGVVPALGNNVDARDFNDFTAQ